MSWKHDILRNRFLQYVVIFSLSLIGAIVCYFLGGKLATLSSDKTSFSGFAIQFGGALVGFFVLFQLSTRWLDKAPVEKSVEVRLSVKGTPVFRSGKNYEASYTITRGVTGEKDPVERITPRRDGSKLILDVRDVNIADIIEARIEDSSDSTVWLVSPVKLTEPLSEASRTEVLRLSTTAESQQNALATGPRPLPQPSMNPSSSGDAAVPRPSRSPSIGGVGLREGKEVVQAA